MSWADFPTNGMGVVLGITRRRASDVGEPVVSTLTFEALTKMAREVAYGRKTEKSCVDCGERVSDLKATRCIVCYRTREATLAAERKAARDAKADARRKYLQKRARYKRLGLTANGKPYRRRLYYALQEATA